MYKHGGINIKRDINHAIYWLRKDQYLANTTDQIEGTFSYILFP
jgi:hypothetical protein